MKNIDWQLKNINNQYIIINYLGKGAYASVWMAYNINDKEYCAIKISNIEESIDYKTCVKESENYKKLKKLNCSYILNIKKSFDYKFDNNTFFFEVMDLMGESLYQFIKKNVLSIDNVIRIVKQVLLCLNTLHTNNFIYGDLKPENILITEYNLEQQNLIKLLNLEQIVSNKKLSQKDKSNAIIKKIQLTLKSIDVDEYMDSCDSSEFDETSSDSDDSVSETFSISSISDNETNIHPN